MNDYIRLLTRLRKQKKKIKDLPELIFKVSFNRNRIILLEASLRLLELNEDVYDFSWFDNPIQRKASERKDQKILGQFNYRFGSPHRVLTVFKKDETN